MIRFKKITYKNFLSTGNTPIEIKLDYTPATLIVGKNGSGKSTLLDALCFVLFNKPFRLVKKEQMVNSINGGDCIVTIDFEVGTKQYKIIRGIKPNIFEIYCNGELVNQNANTLDYQKYLEKNIMKLNYRSFIQVVMLGSSSYEPFMKMKPRYRREVVEEILDIRVFGLMDLILRSQQSDLQKKLTEVRHQCELIETKYETEANHLKSLQEKDISVQAHSQNLAQKNEQDRLNYERKIQDLNNQLSASRAKLENKPKVDKKVNQLSKLESKIETNLLNHKKTLEFFEKNDTCNTCTQPIDKEFKEGKIAKEKDKIQELEKGLKDLLSEIVKTETQINNMAKVSDKISELNIEVAKINTSINEINKHSNRLNDDIIRLESEKENTDKIAYELEQLKDELKNINVEKEKVVEEKKYIDIAREILNDTGVKAKIIKKYLPIMNNLINKYLQSMDFFVNFHLDEEFNETIKSRFRDTFVYNSFSEGEKLRIDLALLFTWRTIAKMKNSTNTNLLILDEIFDSSLDGSGTEEFFKILKQLTSENTFIISHKGDILFDKFTNIIKFEKYKNFTRLA